MKDQLKNVISRRKMLKSTAALSAAAGASFMLGCPAVHASEAPTIRYLGSTISHPGQGLHHSDHGQLTEARLGGLFLSQCN